MELSKMFLTQREKEEMGQAEIWDYFPGEDIAKLEKKWMKEHRKYDWERSMDRTMMSHWEWYRIHREISLWS